MTEARWRGLMLRLSIPPNLDTYRGLIAAYAEKHRCYHTAEHVAHCLALLDEYSELADHADEIEAALWFHDAVYNPLSRHNEAESARWATEFLAENQCAPGTVTRIQRLIMATIHDAPVTDQDAQLMVDIDLAILGADPRRYRVFEANIRREYKWVPAPLFRRERRRILQSFVDRDIIYSLPALQDRYEAQARSNLASAISSLH